MVWNLTWSRAYLRSTFSYALLHKVLKLVPLTATKPKVYVTTMVTIISNYWDSLLENLNHMKSLKLRYHPGENVTYCCGSILVDAERLEIYGAFNPEHIGYIIHICEDTSDPRFHIWVTQKLKEFMDFIKNFFVHDEYFMRSDEIITYGPLVQETIRKYHNIFESKRW